MTPDQKALVKLTWQKVLPIAESASELFYHRLFEIDPALRDLFDGTDMTMQRLKLMQTLGVAIRGLDDLETLLPIVEDLGRRHVGYGVTDAHYETVGAALLWTLEKGLGEAWTPEVADAWTAAYGTLSGAMREAA